MPSRLRVERITPARLELFATHGACVRVGATTNIISRANAYQSEGLGGQNFTGVMYYTHARDVRMCENRLLLISKRAGRAVYNVQRQSNMSAGRPGFVYVILARPLDVYPRPRPTGCFCF